MAKNKISMPQGTAGITRYFDDYKSKFMIKPGYVIVMAGIVVLLVILIQIFILPGLMP
jgi:preprotein translocase subunit Sec61beta